MKKSIILATAVAASLTSGIAAADLSANAGIFSNYIWRGVTQTADSAAGQGGIDWSSNLGLYAGVWTSTIANAQEADFYAGYAGRFFDVGAIAYTYPLSPENNFTEVYASGTLSIVTVGVAYTADAASGNKDAAFDSGDLYVNGSIDYTLGGSDFSLYAGSYMFNADGTGAGKQGDINYSHYGASIGKDGFALALDKNDINADNPALGGASSDNLRITVSYTKDFEL